MILLPNELEDSAFNPVHEPLTGAWFNLRERKIVPPTAAIAACVAGLLRSDNFATLG